jgi:hypothetical protein
MSDTYEHGFAEWLAGLVDRQEGYETGVDATRSRVTVRNAIGETFVIDVKHVSPRARRTRRFTDDHRRLVAYAELGHAIDQNDWWSDAPDGKGSLKAVRTRISELELEFGYGFHHRRRPGRTMLYVLAHTPGSPRTEDLTHGVNETPRTRGEQDASHMQRGVADDASPDTAGGAEGKRSAASGGTGSSLPAEQPALFDVAPAARYSDLDAAA